VQDNSLIAATRPLYAQAPLELFKFISDYLPYFEKINIFFNIITKKV
jgi:hypothetical protein